MFILTAISTFISTNIDDFLILMLLFSQTHCKQDRLKVLWGQYLGVGVIVSISLIAAVGVQLLPEQYIRFLGLIPLFLGVKAALKGDDDKEAFAGKIGVLPVAGLALAGGGDNLGVYIPIFASLSARELALTMLIYLLLIPLWCLLAAKLAKLPAIAELIRRYQRVLVPAVFILLGLMILLNIA